MLDVSFGKVRRAITRSKIAALAICLFTVAAVVDARPDPPATRRSDSAHVLVVLRHRVASHTTSNHAFACDLPVALQLEHARGFAGVLAIRPSAPLWVPSAPFSPRAPPRG